MSAKAGIYLDSNAGTPIKSAVREALAPYLLNEGLSQEDHLYNPSSIHSFGRRAKRAVAIARERIAQSLGADTDSEQIIFTSSGSEANQLAIASLLKPRLIRGEKPHWITSPVEHDSIKQMVTWLEKQGGRVSFIPVDAEGVPQVSALESLIQDDTALISLIWVNNETGAITDVSEFSKIARRRQIPLHIDAAQAWGKLPIHVNTLGAQYVTFSAHKIGALAGTGFLWTYPNTRVEPAILGKQEKSRRGGTENLFGIIAAGAAAETLDPIAWAARVAPLRDRLQSVIAQRIPGTLINGGQAKRVANTLNISFEGVEGDGLVMALDLAGYAVSAGSACSSGVLEPSHVLMAMGRTKTQAMAAIRISFADAVAWSDLEGFVEALEKTVIRMCKARR